MHEGIVRGYIMCFHQACGNHRLQLFVADVYVSADEYKKPKVLHEKVCSSAVSLTDITRLSLFLVTQNLNNQKP